MSAFLPTYTYLQDCADDFQLCPQYEPCIISQHQSFCHFRRGPCTAQISQLHWPSQGGKTPQTWSVGHGLGQSMGWIGLDWVEDFHNHSGLGWVLKIGPTAMSETPHWNSVLLNQVFGTVSQNVCVSATLVVNNSFVNRKHVSVCAGLYSLEAPFRTFFQRRFIMDFTYLLIYSLLT